MEVMEVDEVVGSFAPDTPTDQPLESDPPMPPNANAIAAAAERRLRAQRQEAMASVQTYSAFDENHDKRQEFRRLIDPGILRPNARPLALEALETLKMLADNILKHPGDTKYHRFKPTNAKIKRLLVEPKGTIEYARALGFKPEVEDLQPYYEFNKRRMNDLRIGATVLEEVLKLEIEKEERDRIAKEQEAAVKAAQLDKVKQAFLDDRKSKAMRDRRETQQRALAAAGARRNSTPPASPPAAGSPSPPIIGRTLRGAVVRDRLPPYNEVAQLDDEDYGDNDD